MDDITLFEKIRTFIPPKNAWQDAILDTKEESGYDITTHITTIQGHYGFWISLEEKEIQNLHSNSCRTILKLYVSSEKPRGKKHTDIPNFGIVFIEYVWKKNRRKKRFDLTEKKSLTPLFICLDAERTRFLDDLYAALALL